MMETLIEIKQKNKKCKKNNNNKNSRPSFIFRACILFASTPPQTYAKRKQQNGWQIIANDTETETWN